MGTPDMSMIFCAQPVRASSMTSTKTLANDDGLIDIGMTLPLKVSGLAGRRGQMTGDQVPREKGL